MLEYLKTWIELKGDRRAVTMMEYGLIAALVAVVCVLAITNIGTRLNGVFSTISTDLPAGG
jgi:pilus assembly protein Flp/PilA